MLSSSYFTGEVVGDEGEKLIGVRLITQELFSLGFLVFLVFVAFSFHHCNPRNR